MFVALLLTYRLYKLLFIQNTCVQIVNNNEKRGATLTKSAKRCKIYRNKFI